MIDLHFHCLPGIDDGPREWEDSVSLCMRAGEEGTTAIVATPHVVREPWLNEERSVRDGLLVRLNQEVGGAPRILPGCEYYFSHDALELWQNGTICGLNDSRYLLTEFPSHLMPPNAEAVFHELLVAGVRPVIAHPERHAILSQDLELLQRFVSRGALTQVTAASITGDFGRGPTRAAREMLDAGLVHIVASDAHGTRRPPAMLAARDQLARERGVELAELLTEGTPAVIVANGEV
jgi:protein-tyrosine phosphatase